MLPERPEYYIDLINRIKKVNSSNQEEKEGLDRIII
jgi:hypothetical protein